jgi:hypothetical protein
MSCYFRAHGRAFDVDAFLRRAPLNPDFVWHKGEKRQIPIGRVPQVHPNSGLSIGIGKALSLDQQYRSAERFLRRNDRILRRLTRRTDVEESFIDFMAELRPEHFSTTFTLPTTLIRAAADVGVALWLSAYRWAEASKQTRARHFATKRQKKTSTGARSARRPERP